MEKEVLEMQDFLANGPIICKNAQEILNITETYNIITLKDMSKYFIDWKLKRCKEEKEADINNAERLKYISQNIYAENNNQEMSKIYRLANQLFWHLKWVFKCWICKKAFGDDLLKKVQDHDHITGKYRGSVHSICNLQLQIKPEEAKLNIFFHNMKNYDGHLISKVMGRASQEQISAIPNNMEKYLTFEIDNQRYIDSF